MGMAKRILLLLLGAAYIAILIASLVQRFAHPSLTVANPEAAQAAPSAMGDVGPLMRAVAANPADRDALLRLIRSLMALNQWESAENFAHKAINLQGPEATDPEAQYLLAIIHHNQGRHQDAAELLEKMLAKGDNPSARYSLGILYIHFLNQPQRGIEQLEKGLLAAGLTPALADAMREELARARLRQAPAIKPQEEPAQEPAKEE